MQQVDASILLFDEPDSGFHATAQEELLRFLKELAEQGRQVVVVSTHSEHLIDLDHLTGVRLMTSNPDSAYLAVRNKWNVPTQGRGDVEALRPVRDAIGLRCGASHLTLSDHLVIAEGLSELLYSRAFRQIFGCDEIHLIPANGDEAILCVAALVMGQGLSFKVIVDKKQHGESAKERLKEVYETPDESVHEISIPAGFSGIKGSGIEDVFSKTDFKNLLTVTGSPPDPAFDTITNNEYLKGRGRVPKRAVANWFLGNAHTFTPASFDHETQNNIESLLAFCANEHWFRL